MNRIDQLENEKRQLRDELQGAKARLGVLESNMDNNTPQADESLRKAWETVSRLTKEAEKRTSK
jgi:predicted  nucleic acid-binding Zn-ribbon protein